MLPFVGRDHDSALLTRQLDEVRSTGTGRFVWFRGRRRVGKSRLVQEFCDDADAPYCFYQAVQRPREEALEDFAAAVRASLLPAASLFEDASYSTWPAALQAATNGASAERPVILVLDELPYLTQHDPGFAADLQKAWDRHLERVPVLLICVGSDVRMMEELVQERAPLYGRPTLERALQPLPLPAVAAITGAASADAAIDRYLTVGGFPQLAARWPTGATLHRFLDEALVDEHPFVTTALRIMSSEFSESLSARAVIEAIGHGETAYGKIQSRSGVAGNTLTSALGVLVDTKRMVERRVPYAVPLGKSLVRYTVVDPYLRFWLRFIGPYLAEIDRGRGDLTAARITRDWPAYRGRAVEPLVRATLERMLLTPATATKLGDAAVVGTYWTRNHQVEVDLVGGDAPLPTRLGFVGSIKWHQNEPFSRAERDALVRHRSAVPGAGDARLVIVSRTGTDDGVEADLVLGPEEILGAWS